MDYFVDVKTVGYPNGKVLKSDTFCFQSIEEAESFALKKGNVCTPDFDIVATVYTFIDGRKWIC